MQRFCSPPHQDIKKQCNDLPLGLMELFNGLDRNLEQDWEFYTRPFLNGLRPDLVLLNKNRGILIFQVLRYIQSDLQVAVATKSNQLTTIKREIREIYCPRIGGANKYDGIQSILVFADAPKDFDIVNLKSLAQTLKYHHLETVEKCSADLSQNPPEWLKNSPALSAELCQDLKNWLLEPHFSELERAPLDFRKNPQQQEAIKNRTRSGYRRITGPAGSGKSLIIAAKAAELALLNKNVLVLTFNITLIHYLNRLFFRYMKYNLPTAVISHKVVFINYHAFCKRLLGHLSEYNALWKSYFNGLGNDSYDAAESVSKRDLLDDQIPNLLMAEKDSHFGTKYDAILVDEAQDFAPKWWESVRSLLMPGGEALLCADATQDTYGKAKSWTDATMTGAGFLGNWMRLKISYRMPQKLTQIASDYAKRFLPPELCDLPEPDPQMEFHDCDLRWIQTGSQSLEKVASEEIMNIAAKIKDPSFAISDTTVVVDSISLGLKIAEKIGKSGMKVVHTFSQNQRRGRDLKMAFAMEHAPVKMTTPHSFKGWETRALVIVISKFESLRDRSIFYSSITRVKWHPKGSYLTVVSAADETRIYGSTWPSFDAVY